MSIDASIAIEQEKKLRQLIELAEDNQLAVQDAIVCLTAEREAFAKERSALVKATVNSAEVSDTLRRATAEAIPAIQAATEKAVQTSMDKALGLTATSVAPSWEAAAPHVIERFGSAVQLADTVEERVRRASQRSVRQWPAPWRTRA
jgi:hypothetical protein